MSALKIHVLEKGLTLPYLQENLTDTNSLSEAVFKYVNFDGGSFFTLLKQEVPIEQLYQFKWGGVGGSTRKQISDVILKKLQEESNSICIFDDVGGSYKEPYNDSLFMQVGIHFNEEIYYFINPRDASKELLDVCLYASGGGWHSLCLVSEYGNHFHQGQNLTESDMCNLAKMATCIVIGAYDSEGFVFWEKAGV